MPVSSVGNRPVIYGRHRFDDDIASITISKSEESNFRFRIAYPGSEEYGTMDVDASFILHAG